MTDGVLSVTEARVQRGLRRRFPILVGLSFGYLGVVLLMVLFGLALAPYDPAAQNVLASLTPPSSEHWLGTDSLGRDILSRLFAGAQSAVVGPFVVALVSMVCGNLLGLVSGYRGGLVDTVIMRGVDLMIAIPALLLMIVVAGAMGGGYWLAIALLAVLTVPFDTRVIRAATLEQVPRPYVEAAKTLGVSHRRIMIQHIWPNVAAVTVANTFLVLAGSLVGMSGLSYLGLGAEPGTPDWGQMLAENQALLFSNPIATIAPGVAIVLTATAVNLIGDWIYERISSRGVTR